MGALGRAGGKLADDGVHALAGGRRGRRFDDYHELQRWSVDDLDGFWSALWDFFDVQADGEATPVLASREMPGAKWLPNASLNYAEHAFADKDEAEVAIFHSSELRSLGQLTWGDLREQVAAVAAGLRAFGVERGDRVVASSAPPSSAACRCCRSTAASCRRRRWGRHWRPGTKTATR